MPKEISHTLMIEKSMAKDVEDRFQEMERRAGADLDAEDAPEDARIYRRSADFRYYGEGQEMTVEFPPSPSSPRRADRSPTSSRTPPAGSMRSTSHNSVSTTAAGPRSRWSISG